ncbi:AfsR/SARP family transcriptional regulator [Actinophytocola xanthii]|uniref:AfsR/SARP family transcriptional regulator n=1 Tax=Actinophytocola xanthii TaxID=1912961 RepID=UPI000A7A546A
MLGPLLVTDGSGQWLRLRGDRQRSLLAMLLFNANTHVPVERLVDALWPDLPPKSYASNLHTYLSRLRERIGPCITRTGGGYRIDVDHDDLDLLVFTTEAELGRRAVRAGDPVAGARHLRTALAQWRGHPLADLQLPALDADVTRLAAERLTVFEDCLAAELDAGRDAELVGELETAVAEHPLRERLTALLMTALRRAGRQAEALEAYRRTREILVEQTGVEPGAELRAVHAEVLRGEAEPAASTRPVYQLPADIADFSGRDRELDELVDLLTTGCSPVVLSGQPGVGKSTLAVRLAHRLRGEFPDGQLYVHLAGASNPRAVDAALADLLRTLGVTGPAVPDDLEAKAAVLRDRLADRRVLLVLDDAADPAQVRPLLPGTPSSAVIVTSRQRLSGLAGAHRVDVEPFTDAEAGRLLARIAGERVTGGPADAARIAAACGNLPLALRIAGTRLALRPQLGIGTLADRLEDEVRRFDELTVSDLQVRSSLALSCRALSPAARETFWQIGMVDLYSLPAWAIEMLRPGADAAVEELVESSLLRPAGVDGMGQARYQIHDLVRAYARELAFTEDGVDERRAASHRLVDAALALVDLAARRLPRTAPLPDLGQGVPAVPLDEATTRRVLADPDAWFATERPVLVQGIGVLCRVRRYRMAWLLLERFARYLWLHGHYADLRTCAVAIAEAPDESVAVRANALLALLAHVRGQYTEAVRRYRWCARRLVGPADQQALGWVRTNLADCLVGLGEPEESLRLVASAEPLLFTDEFGLASMLRVKSGALNRLGRLRESVRINEGALAKARSSGSPRRVALALQSLAWSLALNGSLDAAVVAADEAVSLLRSTTAGSSLARGLRTLGAIRAGRGERGAAVAAFEEGREIARKMNERPRVLSCTRAIAASWVGVGRAEEAVPELHTCVREYREMGSLSSATVTLRLLATAYDALGEGDAAGSARAEADRLADPRDANAETLYSLLVNLTRT